MMASLNLGNTTPNKQEEQIEHHLDSHFQEKKTSISDQPVKGRIFMEPPGLPKMEFPPINKDTQIMDKTMPMLETLDYDPTLDPQNKERTMPDLRRMDIQEPSKINTEINAEDLWINSLFGILWVDSSYILHYFFLILGFLFRSIIHQG